MLKHSLLPVVDAKRLPPLFYLSLGGLLALLIVTFVLGARAQQKQAKLLTEYGTALAQISAQEVVEESITSDLVSMHAIMQRVVTQPRVLRAAVHDLEQQLLVQAGQSALHSYNTREFSAPIPLRDGNAGRVTVTMNAGFPGEQAVRWTLSGTALVLVIMIGLALYESRGSAWYFRRQEPGQADEFSENDEELVEELMQEAEHYFADADAEENAGAGEEAAEAQAEADTNSNASAEAAAADLRCDLILALPNRERLQRLLNHERFLQLVAHFEQVMHEVLALYGGTRVGANESGSLICLRFSSNESPGEAGFRALCSAYLISQLACKDKMHFQLVAEVRPAESEGKMAISDTGIFVQASVADNFVVARVQTVEAGDERLRVAGFKGTCAALLERQQEQLQVRSGL